MPETTKFKARTGTIYTISLYQEEEIRGIVTETLLQTIRLVTKSAWGDPGPLAKKWLELSNVFIIAENNDTKKIDAFACAQYIDPETVVLVATMVHAKYQFSGIGVFLNKKILSRGIIKSLKKINTFFKRYYFVFRTPNPILYSRTIKNISSVFPSPYNKTPTTQEKEIFHTIVQRFAPNNPYNEETFTIYQAYQDAPDLIYKPDLIPWSKNKKVNTLFESSLNLSGEEGNTLVIICSLPFYKKIALPFL